ncbi:DUF4397 domain-containing protein [Hymenobacter sp.]|uniref:DUF4397 domain-containing protein n=1 Tax=Hymenobacter sp. TaxID=1898978 RepID=UPI00286CDE74|nr:DUF4397 domain-containing protein [Hymenobacter sp.]
MKTPLVLRRSLFALLPATLLFASCGKDDKPAPAATARVNAYHMAASANVGVKVLFDDAEKATLTYGQNSGYQTINAGSPTIKVNVASSNASAFPPQTVATEKDLSYSYFAYAPTNSTVAGLLVTDQLSAPATGQAKVRLVHLGQGSASPLKLSAPSIAGPVDVPNVSVEFANASSFVEIPAGSYNLTVTTGPQSTVVANVGDGSGMGTGMKTYEAGKIYTVILRGVSNALLSADLQPKAALVQNN